MVLLARPARVVVLVVGVGGAELLHDEHECEAKEERHGDRGSFQRGCRRPTACEGFDTPGRMDGTTCVRRTTIGQTTIGLVLQWLNKLTDVLGNDDA